MRYTTSRRLLAGLAAVGAMIATTATPTLAYAPASFPDLSLYMVDTTVATGTAGKVESPILASSKPVVLGNAIMTFDFTDLAGVATVTSDEEMPSTCMPPSGGRIACGIQQVRVDEWGIDAYFGVAIKAAPGAAEGDTGVLKVTFQAAGIRPLSHQSTVTIGAGVDLAAGPAVERGGAPGEVFSAPLSLRNAGGSTAEGAVALFYFDYANHAERRYSNCTYEGDELRTCRFDGEFKPGASYAASMDYRIGADAYAPDRQRNEILWLTPAEYKDFAAHLRHEGVSVGSPGDGGVLRLEAVAGARGARRVQVDTDPTNNWGFTTISVTGKNGADLVAVGDTLAGSAGEVVTASAGVANEGPATVYFRSGNSVTLIDVSVPDGTTVVTVPADCHALEGDDEIWEEKPGAAKYRCASAMGIAAGGRQTFDFGLRIDSVTANATGTVKINVFPNGEGDGFRADLDPSNDLAKIVVNPSGGGGGGGGLPITGTATASLIAAGAVLLIAGVVGFVIARRRRVRFVA